MDMHRPSLFGANKHRRLGWLSTGLRWFAIPISPSPLSIASGEHNLRPRYRPDINGLRALAIVSVVAYHVFPNEISGGFLGVDVFFVISGFLISTIIFKSLANNSFSFLEFYGHRIRRIFPALIVVVGFCLIVGWNLLLPKEFALLGKHVAASAGFAENYVLRSEASYFDFANILKPLMHVWSLAIEEQFYLVFPLLVWCAWRVRLNLLAVITVICGFSLAEYFYSNHQDQVVAFFSPQSRFWEFMAGAILAHLMLRAESAPDPRLAQNSLTKSVVSFVGLSLITAAMFGINRHRGEPFLGADTVFAVIGAALLISSGQNAWVNRVLLANRVAVFIGLISYPLYLWHWSLLSFVAIADGAYPQVHERLLAVVLSVVLATLTYRLIEQPIRQGGRYRHRITGSLVIGVGALILAGSQSGVFVRSYAQWPSQVQKVAQVVEYAGYPNPPGEYVDDKYHYPTLGHNDKNKVLVIGDSHATQYMNAVAGILKNSAAASSDIPEVTFLESVRWGFSLAPPMLQEIVNDKTVSIVLISDFWALHYVSDKVDYLGRGMIMNPAPLSDKQRDELDVQLISTIKSLRQAGKQVYVILDNPFGNELAPRGLMKRSVLHGIRITATPLATTDARERREPINSRIRNIAEKAGGKVIDPIDSLCDANICPAMSVDGTPLYNDYDHLSLNGLLQRVRYLDFIIQYSPSQ